MRAGPGTRGVSDAGRGWAAAPGHEDPRPPPRRPKSRRNGVSVCGRGHAGGQHCTLMKGRGWGGGGACARTCCTTCPCAVGDGLGRETVIRPRAPGRGGGRGAGGQ